MACVHLKPEMTFSRACRHSDMRHAGLLRVGSAGFPAGSLLEWRCAANASTCILAMCAPQAGSLVLGSAHLQESYTTGRAVQVDPVTLA